LLACIERVADHRLFHAGVVPSIENVIETAIMISRNFRKCLLLQVEGAKWQWCSANCQPNADGICCLCMVCFAAPVVLDGTTEPCLPAMVSRVVVRVVSSSFSKLWRTNLLC
jgi:hypothetical protein